MESKAVSLFERLVWMLIFLGVVFVAMQVGLVPKFGIL